jgi:antitoxin component YwqK of YwqJK toxin-antitoxin module
VRLARSLGYNGGVSDEIKIDDGSGVWPPADFTGLWEVYWPNRRLKYRADYIDGETHGLVTCWRDNGEIAQIGTSQHGKCVGIWFDYWEDGGKFKETEYQDADNFIVRWYDPDGSIHREDRWVNGREVCS